MGKVIEMPDSLERRAQKIWDALDRQEDANERSFKADNDWRGATFELAVELAAAKKELRTTNAFGKWCFERFGDNRISHQDRAALVRWGEDPEGTRTMLMATTSRSIQMIDQRLTRASRRSPTRVNKAEEVVRAIKAETGKWPDRKIVSELSGVSERAVDNAMRTVKAVEEARAAPVEITYTKAQEYHLEARLKVLDAEREKTFEARVTARNQEDIAKLFPRLQEIQNQAELNEKTYREMIAKIAVLTKAEYVDILFCVHNEHVEADRRKRAGIALIAKKLQLTGEK